MTDTRTLELLKRALEQLRYRQTADDHHTGILFGIALGVAEHLPLDQHRRALELVLNASRHGRRDIRFKEAA